MKSLPPTYWILVAGVLIWLFLTVRRAFFKRDIKTILGERYTGRRAVRFGILQLAYVSIFIVAIVLAGYAECSRGIR